MNSIHRNPSTSTTALMELSHQHGENTALLKLTNIRIDRILKDHEFIQSSVSSPNPKVYRSFFTRQVMNLGSNNLNEKISSITTLVVCCLSVVGLIFFLAAIPTHLHDLKVENQLADLLTTKTTLEAALKRIEEEVIKIDAHYSFSQNNIPQRRNSVLVHPAPGSESGGTHPHHPVRTAGMRHLDVHPGPSGPLHVSAAGDVRASPQLPSFGRFHAQLTGQFVPATPSASETHYLSTQTISRSGGSTISMDQAIIDSVKHRFFSSDTSVKNHITTKPKMMYLFEPIGSAGHQHPNGLILHVYHKRGSGEGESVEIWYPNPLHRQDLSKYTIVKISQEDRVGKTRPVTRAEIDALLPHHALPHVVISGTTPVEGATPAVTLGSGAPALTSAADGEGHHGAGTDLAMPLSAAAQPPATA